MSDQDAFERILASLYEAMLDDALWPTTSAMIDEACGTVGNALLVGEGSSDGIQTHFVGIYRRGQRRGDLESEWLEVYHPINEGLPRFRQLPDSKLVFAPDLYTAEELKTSCAYNEGLRLLRAQQGVMVRMDGPAGGNISWVTGDPVSTGGWEAPQVALMKGLLPHLRQFVRVRQALISAEALSMSEVGLLDNTRVGVIHLDQRGRIVEANDRARSILRHSDALTDRGGELWARRPADHARLVRLIARALPTTSALAVSGTMTLRRATKYLPFVLHIKPVGVRQPEFGAPYVAVLVLIIEPGRQSHLDMNVVTEALRLTPAEGQVAVLLTQGQTVREIAVATERTEAAIHYHLHQMYQKHRITRQAELVRLVLSVAEWV